MVGETVGFVHRVPVHRVSVGTRQAPLTYSHSTSPAAAAEALLSIHPQVHGGGVAHAVHAVHKPLLQTAPFRQSAVVVHDVA